MLNTVLSTFSSDVSLDLGTSSTVIHAGGRGVVCNAPSVVAVHEDSNGKRRIVAVGDEAQRMSQRTPESLVVVRPVRDGVIADYEVCESMLRHLMVQLHGRRLWVGPRVAVCIAVATSEAEKRAVREAAESAGAREVFLVERPLASAVGMGLPVHEARGHMVLDIGGGTTTAAVLSLGGVVVSEELKIGGDALNQAIVEHVLAEHQLHIGPLAAEALKRELGTASPAFETARARVSGKDAHSVFPREVSISREEIRAALATPLALIGELVLRVLEQTPPDLAADIADVGMVVTGGGAQLAGIDRMLSGVSGLPVVASEQPTTDACLGAAAILDDATMLVAAAC